ncbi:hypothetical protein GO755_26445 [Spirosoma sp. HMF4905]|uniref:Uncharacterized protein n=1 Tax=Spirosoma arboris TaxID=2682092 RepID=A0A7K1SJ55_9BACT|nr:hypothetical protein [Spirosoma arboris]MVM33606.1 hypothetical protein [Spirosoma arboris]
MNPKSTWSKKDRALGEVLIRHELNKLSYVAMVLLRWTGLSGWFIINRINRNTKIAVEYKKLAEKFDKDYAGAEVKVPAAYERILNKYYVSKN